MEVGRNESVDVLAGVVVASTSTSPLKEDGVCSSDVGNLANILNKANRYGSLYRHLRQRGRP